MVNLTEVSTSKKPAIRRPDIVLNEVLLKRAAALSVVGTTVDKICTELAISRLQYEKLVSDPRFDELITRIGEDDEKSFLETRRSIRKLVAKAIKALDEALDKGSLEAVKIVFKSIGLDEKEQDRADASVTVILPGAAPSDAARVIDITDTKATVRDESSS